MIYLNHAVESNCELNDAHGVVKVKPAGWNRAGY